MTLKEFQQKLAEIVAEKGIPEDAEIDYIDISYLPGMYVYYDRTTNHMSITD
jgi:hypothetical protein